MFSFLLGSYLTFQVPSFTLPISVKQPNCETMVSSWYGPGFHGRRTANGEIFNQNALTAAHRTLPFGTRLRLINSKTGAIVEVRINDRGPYHRGRQLDVSREAARQLGFLQRGVSSLKVCEL